MNLINRISSFAKLGALLPGFTDDSLIDCVLDANRWFTRSESQRALNAWSSLLTLQNLTDWTSRYAISDTPPLLNILVITAGNIPLVGFHDFLSVLLSGNRFVGKLSSRDDLLLTHLTNELIGLEPQFANLIDLQYITDKPDAVIATGSNNSSRYFRREYGHLPHVIRKNRSSAAILDGSETNKELDGLAADILEYYGLGCRSVSQVYLPAGFSPERLVEPVSSYNRIDPCYYLRDNLRYQRARLSMLDIPFIDARHVLFVQSELLHPPIGVVHYSFYKNHTSLFGQLENLSSHIQCLTGHESMNSELVPFGTAQKPELWDYADNLDTLEFLIKL